MAKKTYVVAEGMAFTAMGHIFGGGEEIPESVFSDNTYFTKMVSLGKIIQKNSEEPVEAPAEETPAEEPAETPVEEKAEETAEAPAEETPAESTGTKKSTSKGGK